MNPIPDIASPTAMYALSTAVGMIGLLVGVIWTMLRAEVKSNNEALSRKASNTALDEVKKAAAEELRDTSMRFDRTIERNHHDYKERLSVLEKKQDREIDWLKQELRAIAETQAEMRRESNLANNTILAHLRTLAGTRSTT